MTEAPADILAEIHALMNRPDEFSKEHALELLAEAAIVIANLRMLVDIGDEPLLQQPPDTLP